MTELPLPERIHRDDHQLVVTWSSRHVSVLPARQLRWDCQCAACRDEMTGALLLREQDVEPDVAIRSVRLVGAYGIQIVWSDGHDAGIYPYDLLLASCRCEACTSGAGP